MDLEMMCQQATAHQRQLLMEAERRRLQRAQRTDSVLRRSWRERTAAALRRIADRLEPAGPSPQSLPLLRAVAHREIDVDQALQLLNHGSHRRSSRN